MKTNSKVPLLVSGEKLSFTLEGTELAALIENPRPVLYSYKGLYTWINVNQIKNAIRRCKDEELRAKNNDVPYTPHITFKWNRNVTDVHLADAIKELLEKK